MDKSELKQALVQHHTIFASYIQSIPVQEVSVSRQGKWSPAQLLEHILKSIGPVQQAFSLPPFMLRLLFGSSNRPSRSYEVLVAKYRDKLNAGGRAPGRFVPKNKGTRINELSKRLLKVTQSLVARIDSYTEEQLDLMILPHPLLGKLTLREMLYFTIYHVQHHQQQINSSKA